MLLAMASGVASDLYADGAALHVADLLEGVADHRDAGYVPVDDRDAAPHPLEVTVAHNEVCDDPDGVLPCADGDVAVREVAALDQHALERVAFRRIRLQDDAVASREGQVLYNETGSELDRPRVQQRCGAPSSADSLDRRAQVDAEAGQV